MKNVVMGLILFVGLISGVNLFGSENLEGDWSPRVSYSIENDDSNSYTIGLDFKHNRNLIGVDYEKSIDNSDYLVGMNYLYYYNNLETSNRLLNVGVGLEIGAMKDDFLFSDSYITPKVSVIYNKDLMFDVKYRYSNFIFSVGYSF